MQNPTNPTTHFFYQKLGLLSGEGWNPYQKTLTPFLKSNLKASSKLFIRCEDFFLFSIKKVKAEKRNNKLELFGGHLDSKENPEEALLRELKEEDKSFFLMNAFAESLSLKRPLFTRVFSGKNRQYFLYLIDITTKEKDELLSLSRENDESYGIDILKAEEISPDQNTHRPFTPRTLKMFRKIL